MEKNSTDIVKYDNYLNTICFNKFTAVDYNFLMMLCAKLKDIGTKEIEMSFLEIKKATNYPTKNTNERFVRDLARMNKKLLHVTFGYENKELIEMFVLFTSFTIDKIKQTLTISVNEKYTYLLNELTSQFTKFELKKFNKLSSKYSKTLFRLFMQYRKTGFVRISKDNLMKILCVPNSYKTSDLLRKIINPSIEELSLDIKDLKMDIVRENTRGNPIKEFIFTFKKSNKRQIERILEPKAEEKSLFQICL